MCHMNGEVKVVVVEVPVVVDDELELPSADVVDALGLDSTCRSTGEPYTWKDLAYINNPELWEVTP